MKKKRTNVGIFIFDEVEVLDFAGPFEVFAITEDPSDHEKLFSVFTVAEESTTVKARNGLEIVPRYSFESCPAIDILVVPGGHGAEKIQINNHVALAWIRDRHQETRITASICTGAFLLAKSGVLTDQAVTTHWMDLERLQNDFPRLTVVGDRKFVDQGKILTSAGISAGIELSLYIVARTHGRRIAVTTARRMDYDWGTAGEAPE